MKKWNEMSIEQKHARLVIISGLISKKIKDDDRLIDLFYQALNKKNMYAIERLHNVLYIKNLDWNNQNLRKALL
jgi:hypothetical protein